MTEGQILFKGEDITEADPDERARMGLFMAFQYPVSVPGVTVTKYLRTVMNAHREARGEDPIPLQGVPQDGRGGDEADQRAAGVLERYLNEGFSGGEKKRMEILQLALQQPELAILDETDSGLDIDALRVVANGVNAVAGPDMGVLIITHYQRILHLVQPSHVHVHVPGADRQGGRPGAGRRARGQGLRLDHRRGRAGAAAVRRRRPRALAPTSACAVPGPRAAGSTASQSTYLDSAATVADAAAGDRRDDQLLHATLARRSTAACIRWRSRRPTCTRARAARIAAWLGSTRRGDDLRRQRDRGDQPGRLHVGPPERRSGDLVVLTEMEHHSNIVPWQLLCQDREAELAYVPVHRRRAARPRRARRAAGAGPSSSASSHVSNVLGTINPVDGDRPPRARRRRASW